MEDLNRHSSVIVPKMYSRKCSLSNKYTSLPKIPSDPSLNPDLCLNRKDILEEDKKKNFLSLFCSKTPRDISHILDIPLKSSRKSQLPVGFIDMKKWLNENKARNPTSLKETENVEKWLNEMTKSHLPELENVLESDSAPDNMFVDKVESIYFLAMNELLKQVSVQCKSRAELLKFVIHTLATVWKKYPDYLVQVIHKEKEKKLNDLETANLTYKVQMGKLNETIKKLEGKVQDLSKELQENQGEIAKLKEYITSASWEYEEFLIFKAKRMKMESIGCQTELLEESSSNESLESSSDDSSLSDSSLLNLKVPNIKYDSESSHCSDNVEETEKQLRSQLKNFLDTIDPPNKTDISVLVEQALSHSKDCESWLIGFKTGLSLSSKHNLNIPLPDNSNIEDSSIQRKSKISLTVNTKYKPTQLIRKTNTSRNLNDSSVLTPRDINSVAGVIANITSQPFSKLAKQSKISQKKVSDHVYYYINTAILKKYSKNSKFSEFIFLKFIEKYNIKGLAERKFQELVTGCLLYSAENPKFSWFLRALHAGKSQDLPDLSLEGCEMFIKLYEFMLQSRIGVMPESSNFTNSRFFPYLRALECIRCKFENILNKQDFSGLFEQVGKIVVSDPNSINKPGLVEIDKFVDISMDYYEKFIQKIKNGASLCTKVMTEYHFLTKGEICVILRHFCPHKYLQVLKALPLDDQGLIDKEEFIEYCIGFGVLSSQVVSEFFAGYEKNVKGILEYLESNETQILLLSKTHEETLSTEEWESKIFELKIKLKCQDLTKYLQLWHILKKEINFLSIPSN